VSPLSHGRDQRQRADARAPPEGGCGSESRDSAKAKCAIMTAARSGSVEAVRLLVRHGANVNAVESVQGPDRADVGRGRG
jgi:hypothetical protein